MTVDHTFAYLQGIGMGLLVGGTWVNAGSAWYGPALLVATLLLMSSYLGEKFIGGGA